METLDQLITKFKEYKEELTKSLPFHDTVDGFMTGLKTLPKGSPERGKFITSHMNHGPFLNALNTHPQGKQMHAMLTGHLNSAANAGFKPGKTQVMAKSDEDIVDTLEKKLFGDKTPKLTGSDKIAAVAKQPIQAMNSKVVKPAAPPRLTGMDRIRAESQRPMEAMNAKVKKDEDDDVEKGMVGQMKGGGTNVLQHPNDMSRANAFQSAMSGSFQPKIVAPAAPAAKLTGMDRIKALSQQPIKKGELLKQMTSEKDHANAPFGKTVNNSYSPGANGGEGSMQMSRDEKISLSKNGQWNLAKSADACAKDEDMDKDEGLRNAISKLHSETKITNAMNQMRAAPKPVAAPIMKAERCEKCHAKPCECQTTGVLVD